MNPRDRGSATAELAVALPAVVVLLVAGVLAIAAVTAQLGCVATARDTVLALARGDHSAVADGVSVRREGAEITVRVLRNPVSCSATAVAEPGVQ